MGMLHFDRHIHPNVAAHYRGSAGHNYGKREQQPQHPQEHPAQYSTGHQQQVQSGNSPYHEQSAATPTYDEFQQLPPITSLLGNVSTSAQQSESQQQPAQHRPLSRVQSSPSIRGPSRQSRSPLPQSNLRTQAYGPQTLQRRDSSSFIPQQWREEETFQHQPSYSMG